MAGDEFYLGSEGRWRRRGWLDVLPGQVPQDPSTPPAARPFLQITSMQATAVPRPVVEPPVDPPPPPPPTGTILWGQCPHNDGSIPASLTKFGSRSAMRVFDGGRGIGGTVQTRPATISLFHMSYKAGSNATFTRAQLVRAFANFKDGDYVEVNHEHDNDADIPGQVASKKNFAAAVRAAREAGDIPNVLTVDTFTGYAFASENGANQDAKYGGSDILGSDWDGIDPFTTRSFSGAGYPTADPLYYDFYAHEYAEGVAYMNKHGYQGWCIPEFSTFRSTTRDPDGTVRIGWMQQQVAKLRAAPVKPTYVAFFDFSNRPTVASHLECLELSNEITYWRSLVASNPV